MRKKFLKRGFTLIELLVVVSIIGVLAGIILVSLNAARAKGANAAIKSNMINAAKQAEIFYNTNTAVPFGYTQVCVDPGPVGGAQTLVSFFVAAGKAAGIANPYYSRGAATQDTMGACNDTVSAWAAEMPMKTTPLQFWCVDSSGKSLQTSTKLLTATNDICCGSTITTCP